MKPRISVRPAFRVFGTLTRVMRGEETPELFGTIWSEFESHRNEIESLSTDQFYYGVSLPTAEQGIIEYLAGMAVPEDAAVPRAMEGRMVPSAEYAVFECSVTRIGETYRHIFTEWLPASEYALDVLAPSFEQYPPAGEQPRHVLIHIPVRRGSSQ